MKLQSRVRRILWIAILSGICSSGSWSQTLSIRPAEPNPTAPVALPLPAPTLSEAANSIPLTVPAGTPLKVALDQEVRIREVGQAVHGKIVEPVYSFDKIVVPAVSEVTGRIAGIDGVSKMKRVEAAVNANFSPYRQIHIEFDELLLADGRHLPLHTVVSPASQGVLRFAPAMGKGIKEQPAEARKG